MAINGGFAGGLAQGLHNGVRLYNAASEGMERKRQREVEQKLREAMQENGDLGLESIALQQETQPDRAQPATPDQAGLGTVAQSDPQAMNVTTPPVASVSTTGQQNKVSPLTMEVQEERPTAQPFVPPQAAGLVSAGDAAPSLAMVQQGGQPARQQPQQTQQPQQRQQSQQTQQMPTDLERMNASLTRGYRRALELGEPAKALQLYVQREQLSGQYRDQAYASAMDRFDLTGDPNAFVSYINMFDPQGGSFEVQRIETRQEQAGGQPVYVVHGINHETGAEFSQPFSGQSLMNYVGSAGDAAAYRGRFAAQAKHLYDMAQKQADADIKVNSYNRMQETAQRNRLEQIQAQGQETRRNSAFSAGLRGGSGGRGGQAPADVRTAEWLIEQGVAKDPTAAWELVRGARSKPRETYILETAKMLLANQDPMAIGDARLTPQRAVQMAGEVYDSIGGRASTDEAGAEFDPDAFLSDQMGGGADLENRLRQIPDEQTERFDPNAFLNNF